MPKEIYMVLYYLTIFVHYVGTAVLLYWVVFVKLKLSWAWYTLIWFVVWLSAGFLCDGCPYTYVQEWFAYKAWGVERTYDFTQSLLYQLIFKHI